MRGQLLNQQMNVFLLPSYLALSITFLLAAGCADTSDAMQRDSGAINADANAVTCPAGESLALTLRTDDGVDLVADLYPTQNPTGAPAVIFLHMIPPSNSKANYPVAFAEAFQNRGFTVLNLNRRGAPGSGGVANEAYTGPAGKLDAKAAYDYLTNECGISGYSMIGASNGTTTITDFAIFAAETASIQAPASLIYLSGGPYTESQNSISVTSASMPASAFFAYPSAEAAWNLGIETIAPAGWRFTEYAPGTHGTGLITSNPEITDALLNFLDP